ncbi:MAG TPA: hypothetical protein VF622_08355 [Segetibacter sp.]|jgi:hypothetical protein
MKKLFLFLFLLPAFANAQCIDWIGQPATDISAIEKVIQKYLDFDLKKPYKADKGYAYYSGNPKTSMVRLSFMKKTGSAENIINSIYISGPSSKIDRMITEYFEPTLTPCVKDKASNMFSWGNMILVHDFEGSKQNNAIKTIEIRKK